MSETPIAPVFLAELYGTDAPGWLTLFAIDRETGNRHVEWARADTAGQHVAARQAHTLADRCCVWFGVATRRERLANGRGGHDDCELLPGLWLDLDIAGPGHKDSGRLPANEADALKILATYPLPPTVIVHSGGGLQAWWLFHELQTVDRVVDLLDRWAYTWQKNAGDLGYHVDNVFDVARIMRLPGTTNRKVAGDPKPVTVAGAVWDRRYNIDDLDSYTLDRPAAGDLEPAQPAYIGPQRPGDAFNAVQTGAQVLTAAGFVHGHTDTQGAHYTRPGKDPRHGTSATVYDDGHTTIWSDTVAATWPAIEIRRPYDPFGLYACLFHAGDHAAASDTLSRQGYGARAIQRDQLEWAKTNIIDAIEAENRPTQTAGLEETPDLDVDLPAPVDWPVFWASDHNEASWHAEPLLARGRSHAIYAPAKAGKSLFMLDICASVATGRPTLHRPAGEPEVVLYLDYEMTESDLQERLEDMGYGPDDNLDNLRYYLLPTLPPLDTREGAATLAALVRRDQAAIVVVDTTGRAIAGDENDADTIRDYYRHTGTMLKRAGITTVRIDHAGKDLTKGQRGSSAKNDDVDIVWRLTAADSGVTLNATHRRLGWVPETVRLERTDNPLRHRTAAKLWTAGTREVAELLDELGVPVEAYVRQAQAALRDAGHKHRTTVISDAVRWRKSGLDLLDESVSGETGNARETQVIHRAGNATGNATGENTNLQVTDPGNARETPGNADRPIMGNRRVPIRDTLPRAPFPDLSELL